MSSRRNFLKSSAGLAATWAASPLAGAQPAPAAVSLPKVRFGDVEISRTVMGSNAYQYAFYETTLKDLALFRSRGGDMHLIATDPTLRPVEEAVRRSGAG